MSIDGLNVFGSLTVNGKKLTFEDFDTNKDGKISEEEFNALLQKEECDTLELSTIDADGDKVITEEEFADFEAKAQIQEELNSLQATIAKDFTGKNAQYASQVMSELKEFASSFVSNYTGSGDMVADFKAALPAKYEEIKTNILNNTPEAIAQREEQEKQDIKSNVLDTFYESLYNELSAKYPDLAKDMATQICKQLQTAANTFVKSYSGFNLEADLTAHLESKLNENDAAKMESATADYRAVVTSMGSFIDENEFAALKEAAKEFLTAALNNGIILTLSGRKCSTEAQIDAALKTFTNADELNTAIENLISSLSAEGIKDSVVNTKIAEKTATEEKAFAALKGSDIHVESETLNFSNIPGYFENKTVTVKKQGKDGAKDDAVTLLESTLKEQIKSQVAADLKAKGVPEEKLNQIFENVFTQSAWEAADACVSGKKGGLFRHSKSSFKTQDLVNKFIEIFNTNIAKTIDEMNKSNTDMDLQDVDWSQAVTDENGNVDPELKAAIESGETVKTNFVPRGYDTIRANKMIDKMKSTMMAKAMAMCEANGIEFNSEVFNTMFDNAKGASTAVNVKFKLNGGLYVVPESTINPQQLLKDFATNFKESYTAWVESEKAKSTNK